MAAQRARLAQVSPTRLAVSDLISSFGSAFVTLDEPMVACLTQSAVIPRDVWISDSGATKHYANQLKYFSKDAFQEVEGSIAVGNGQTLPIKGYGLVSLPTRPLASTFKAFYVPSLVHSLFSVQQICDIGHKVTINATKMTFLDGNDGHVIGGATRASANALYTLDVAESGMALVTAAPENASIVACSAGSFTSHWC